MTQVILCGHEATSLTKIRFNVVSELNESAQHASAQNGSIHFVLTLVYILHVRDLVFVEDEPTHAAIKRTVSTQFQSIQLMIYDLHKIGKFRETNEHELKRNASTPFVSSHRVLTRNEWKRHASTHCVSTRHACKR